MQTIKEINKEISPLFKPILGEFRVKTYFSYYAIFKHNFMIALYQNGVTYLRLSKQDCKNVTQHITTHNLCDDKIGLQSRKFYFIPHNVLTNTPQLTSLINSTLEELLSERQKIDNKRSTQIRTLPNMSLKLERILKKVGIHSVQDFIEAGYISVFVKLIMQGFDVNEDLLFKLNGALNHQYIYTFTEEQKLQLMQEADHALYALGLRKRFNTRI